MKIIFLAAMKIEISKKHIIVAAISIAIVVLSLTGGYFFGFDKGIESTENPKGDGSHFYMESFEDKAHSNQFFSAEKLVYHSTLDCPNIRNGVEMDGYGYYYTVTKGKVPYTFCSKCMTDFLISECEDKITSAYPDDVKN